MKIIPGDGDPGGGGGTPTTFFVFTPGTLTIATAGTPVVLLARWGGGSVGLLSPGAIIVGNGIPVTVTPSATTTYSLTFTPGVGSPITLTSVITVGGIAGSVRRFLDVRFGYTEPAPLGSCSGFELATFIGPNPDNTDNWLQPLVALTPIDRRYVGMLTLVPPLSVNVAIRALYQSGKKSGWSIIAAAVQFL